ncbi:MAG: hypothetical protein A2W29_13510 [Gemmatimonadetes bacterium RBG_16_66_8]|nr:MAG: hypothetical protein A2W29_13510 [Gemmatimonadetes bacterium RBG_16_66_8]
MARGVRLAALIVALASPAAAQPYARFAVPDSALDDALRTAVGDFENAWNALLVAELRARLAAADSAAMLANLERRVSTAEPRALGTRIATDAMAARAKWTRAQCALRVRAAESESLAIAAQSAHHYEESDSLFRAALAAYRTLGERRRIAWVLGSLGSTYFRLGDYVHADSLYREALDARRAIGDSALVARALNTLGSIAYVSNRPREALPYYQQARSIRVALGERGTLASTFNFMALAAAKLAEHDSALVWYQEALDIAVARGDSARTLEVLINYDDLLRRLGGLDRALAGADRAVIIAEQLGDAGNLAKAHHLAGLTLRQQGRYSTAARRLEMAADLARDVRDTRGLIEILMSLGELWDSLQDPVRARPPLLRARALADSLGDPEAGARALNNLAIAARLDGDMDEAARLGEQAHAAAVAVADSTLIHDTATTLGQIAWDRGDMERAQAWFARAATASEEFDAELRSGDLINVAVVATRMNRLDEAAQRCREAIEIATHARVADRIWPALLALGDIAERRGDMAGALRFDRSAATLIDTLRGRQSEQRASIALFSRRLFAYEALIHLLGKLDSSFPDSGYSAEAFQWAERARARSALDLIEAAVGADERTMPLSLERARALLTSPRQALLEYSLGDSSSSLWVVTRSTTRRIALPAAGVLRGPIETFRHAMGRPTRAETRSARVAGLTLYRLLIEPAEPDLKGITRLIVAPDGALGWVPFEALPGRDLPPDPARQEEALLLDRFDISYTPSATLLAATLARRRTSDGGVVVVADPRFGSRPDGAVLRRLPGTSLELQALRSLARNRPFVALTGKDATCEGLFALDALPRAAMLHFATHGEASDVEPERTGLWMAASRDSISGFVSAADILGWHLGAETVALSACETGLGRLERGEGVLGLTRAFLVAGARSVVVGLWEVNDLSTAQLMESFYRGLLKQGFPPERALATAKRAMRANRETSSPYYWAAFVLVGAGGPME